MHAAQCALNFCTRMIDLHDASAIESRGQILFAKKARKGASAIRRERGLGDKYSGKRCWTNIQEIAHSSFSVLALAR